MKRTLQTAANRGHLFILLLVVSGGFGCSSLTGPVLSEKQIRSQINTDYTISDPEFRASASHLLGSPFVDGNKMVPLQNGGQIFPAMLEAIRAAQTSINLETFIWRSGKVSAQFVDALCERARAGVEVHVIVDWLGSLYLKKKDSKRLREAGVKFVRLNPLVSIKFFRFNHRTHRKLMIVDGKVGFIGGVCISDDWSGNAERGKWRDIHFRVEGPVVAEMQGVFCGNWLAAKSQVLHGAKYFPPLKPTGSMACQCFPSGPRDHAEQARLSYLFAMAAARKHIVLAHAYFVPDSLAIQTLLDARKRGVKVEVIIPRKIDNAAVHMASRSRLGKLLEAGVEFYEYNPTLYHCKIMIVDDLWATVGSVNFDAKSFRANDEANLNILDKNFAATLAGILDEDKRESSPLTKEDFRRQSGVTRIANYFVGLFHADL